VPILVKLSGFDPSWSAFWRCTLGALFLAPLVFGRHRALKLSRREWFFLGLGWPGRSSPSAAFTWEPWSKAKSNPPYLEWGEYAKFSSP
jgi:hypothetical protein